MTVNAITDTKKGRTGIAYPNCPPKTKSWLRQCFKINKYTNFWSSWFITYLFTSHEIYWSVSLTAHYFNIAQMFSPTHMVLIFSHHAKLKQVHTLAALFYSPVDCTDASDMDHSNASLMHRWINRWIKQRSHSNLFSVPVKSPWFPWTVIGGQVATGLLYCTACRLELWDSDAIFITQNWEVD